MGDGSLRRDQAGGARPARGLRWPVVALVVVLAACDDPVGVPPEGAVDLAAPWRSISPTAVSLDANALFVAAKRASEIERLRSLLVVRHGQLAFERYFGGMGVDSLADIRSVTKSVVSTLVGIAVESGDIDDIDEPITHYLDEKEFGLRPEHRAITIRHLLTMSGGWEWSETVVSEYNDWITSPDHVDYLLSRPLDAAPGTKFSYNSAAVHLLGVVLAKAVDESLPDYADEVLFGPLGIRERRWEELADGYVNGGAGLDLRPRDLARIGQLYLQKGWSAETRLVPATWVDAASWPQWPRLWGFGPIDDLSYGFLWWSDLDNDAFFAWGYGGQFIYVVPRLDMVVIVTTDWRAVSQDVGPHALEEQALALIVERVLPAAK